MQGLAGRFKGKTEVTFNEYFEVMSKVYKKRKRNMKDVEFDVIE